MSVQDILAISLTTTVLMVEGLFLEGWACVFFNNIKQSKNVAESASLTVSRMERTASLLLKEGLNHLSVAHGKLLST